MFQIHLKYASEVYLKHTSNIKYSSSILQVSCNYILSILEVYIKYIQHTTYINFNHIQAYLKHISIVFQINSKYTSVYPNESYIELHSNYNVFYMKYQNQ